MKEFRIGTRIKSFSAVGQRSIIVMDALRARMKVATRMSGYENAVATPQR